MIKINDLIWEESLIYVTLLYRINSFRATPLITFILDYDDKKHFATISPRMKC